MSETSTIAKTRSECWRTHLGSALRTTLACTIVGCTSLYGPEPIERYIKFPAFSYVTTILIVSDATLGDTLKGCWHVLCATIQVMILSQISFQVIRPENFSNRIAALALAASAFLVALPASTNLMTKRIAFGQLVIVYVSTIIYRQEGVAVHSIHVACSAALGALASVLAMLLPYPRLAYDEAMKFYRIYTKNTSERLNCNIEAISASDNSTAVGFKTQAEYLSTTGTKLHQSIITKLDGMHWEQPQRIIFNSNRIDTEAKLQDLDITIRGMDIALSSCKSFPVGVIDEELRGVLLNCRGLIGQKLDQQANCSVPFDATTIQEMKQDIFNKYLSIAYKDLPTSFFLYCVQLLLDDLSISNKIDHVLKNSQISGGSKWSYNKIKELLMNLIPSNQSLNFALKSSLSLGLAVLFGLIYDRENALWSGLTIAISFVTGRQPTFTVANARGQGTAMGSIYGIICAFIFSSSVDLRFLCLIPWVIFVSFLRHSRMYGESGGISAVIGALLILGRMNYYVPPSQFGVARMAEAAIGLTCFIIVEVLLSPSRAATLAKSELSRTIRTLQDCVKQISMINHSEIDMSSSSYQALREEQKKLKLFVCQLEEFTAEAEREPNFWFLPFHTACYSNMLESLSRTVDLLLFVAYSMEHVTQLAQKDRVIWMDLQYRGNENVKIFKDKADPILKSLEEITRMKSFKKLENELKSVNVSKDIESQEYPNVDAFRNLSRDEVVDNITNSFLQHLEEIASKTHTNKDEEMLKVQMILHYSCFGFCTSSLMREIMKIESEIKELLIWENSNKLQRNLL
ncbi:uncharacterized protein [Cicer arietinum]|uniref:Uncharacterized protein LOC101503165 n=1 Tax=Cicer arietinum TaxID=3827 RepID=A0A1S3E0V3_CICAR|nr:uncharacterized protein LOC101503165 [Cicer arietinum]